MSPTQKCSVKLEWPKASGVNFPLDHATLIPTEPPLGQISTQDCKDTTGAAFLKAPMRSLRSFWYDERAQRI